MAKKLHVSELVVRKEISSRGGGVEIDLTRKGFKGHKMAVYQNYLGGGMLGSIGVNDTIRAFNRPCSEKQSAKLDKIGLELQQYFHSLTNPDDEWEGMSFEKRQSLPSSAY